MHELAHMVHSEHDNNFHMLNRQLEKEAVQLDWTKSGGHRLGGADVNPADAPTDSSDASGGAYQLGTVLEPPVSGARGPWRALVQLTSDRLVHRPAHCPRLHGPGGDRTAIARQAPRDLMLQAALIRLTAEEQAVTDACGSGSSAPSGPPTSDAPPAPAARSPAQQP